ncbi:3-hydroxyacyl-CoA dehydrogenase [Actinokineospora spheciospongiae]|uniref:3-hydroxyacyl-CoA dehydrogenase n=1 Tax=Actinokineospora spheciospongiae TaxID=909613 RepID=W7IIS7_9PSEU|nr:3-hydroxyacyl-CoA dehydrogenase NAD-binding domain-containing protein [Actinokineospora spheciospongiae]EWC60640.1 3-hydroxyacyl-CoA dehydrogenase [Actinokineospora spheciospongiae]
MSADSPGTVAVIGAGTIGLSWAVLFAAHGWSVHIQDPRPDLEEAVAGGLRQFAPTLLEPVAAEVLERRVRVHTELGAAVNTVDLVQENGPEDLGFKQRLFADLAAAAPAGALLASSTSGLQPSDIAEHLADAAAARVVVAHPFNPPHLLPLVEVVAGSRTSPDAVERAMALYRGLGKVPVHVRKETPGFVANRLQSAMFREAVDLVLRGVVTPAELDTVVTESVGPRWATGGPFLSYHLGGGPGGFRHFLEHLGPGMARRWRDLGTPELTDEVIARLVEATEGAYAGQDYADLTRARDLREIAVLNARAQARTDT